jgi:thiol-disulfide isomerase/thioredoxin
MLKTLLAAGLLLIALSSDATEARREARLMLQPAVDRFSAVDLQGKEWSAADFRGRVVLIDFWATWCAPCLAEIPTLRRLRDTLGSERFEVVGVSVDSIPRRDFVAWINRQNVTWPQVFDGRAFNGPLARLFEVEVLPTSILVGPDGQVAGRDLRGAALRDTVQRLLQRTSTSSFDAARVPIVIR